MNVLGVMLEWGARATFNSFLETSAGITSRHVRFNKR